MSDQPDVDLGTFTAIASAGHSDCEIDWFSVAYAGCG
jgi:hypothetical protein